MRNAGDPALILRKTNQAGLPADTTACELLAEAECAGRGISPNPKPGTLHDDPAMGAEEELVRGVEACAVHEARRAVLDGGGRLDAGGGGAAAVGGGGGGPAPALAIDARKDSQPDDLSLFEVD